MNQSLVARADAVMRSVGKDFGGNRHIQEVLWTIRPMVALAYATSDRTARDPHPVSRTVKRRVRSGLAGARRTTLLRVWTGDGALFASETRNERRVLEPIIDGLGGRSRSHGSPSMRVTYLGKMRLRDTEKAFAEGLGSTLGGEIGWPHSLAGLVADQASLNHAVGVASRSLEGSRRLLEQFAPGVVVVSTQLNLLVRALLTQSRALGIPTVYFPHAPAADNLWYEDLPFDYVGLRGEGERDYYHTVEGVSVDGLRVVGNPSMIVPSIPSLDPASPPVLALSPLGEPRLGNLIRIVHEALGDDVVVALHPRQSRSVMRGILPRTWTVWSGGSTAELLMAGPPLVVQHSSGVAWEALRLGIPTVQIALDDDPPNYLLIRDPYVESVSSSDELRRIASEPSPNEARRNELIEYAQFWSAPIGVEAVAECRRMITDAASGGCRTTLVNDRWVGTDG